MKKKLTFLLLLLVAGITAKAEWPQPDATDTGATENATMENPVDMTQLIATPNYAEGHDNGWQGDEPQLKSGCAALYNKTDSFDYYQHITNLPNGVYRINVQAMFRATYNSSALYAGGVCNNPELERAFVYGESGGLRMRNRVMGMLEDAQSERFHSADHQFSNGLFVPGALAGFAVWTEMGYYSDNETYVLVTDGTLRMGLYCDYIHGADNWCGFNNWTLAYCGTGEDAYAKIREQVENFMTFDETKVQAALRDEYNAKIAALASAATPEEILAAYDGMIALQDAIPTNIQAFEEYMAAVAEVQAYLEEHTDFSGDGREFLENYFTSNEGPGNYPNGSHLYIVENRPLSTAQLAEETAYVQQLLESAIKNGAVEGADITNLIATPNYAEGHANGWLGDSPLLKSGCAVVFDKTANWDFYQEIKDMPNGVYRINVQGMFRAAYYENALYAGGVCHNPLLERAFIYGESGGMRMRNRMMGIMEGAQTTRIHSSDYMFSEDLYVPGALAGFAAWTELGLYGENQTYVLVTDGTLRMGLYCDYIMSGNWCGFNNWSLEYCGTGDAALAQVRGQMMDFAFDDSKVQTALQEEYYAKIDALADADTPEEIQAVCEGLIALEDAITFNLIAFDEYMAAMAEVQAYLEAHTDFSGPGRDFLEEYFNSYDEPGDYPNGGHLYIVENLPLNTAQLAEEITYVQQLLEAALQGGIIEGTDLTSLLANTDMSQAKFEGWNSLLETVGRFHSAQGVAAFPVAEAYNTPFHINQTLEDVPNGVYELQVNAFYRWGTDWAYRDNEVIPAVLYLNEFDTPIQNITVDMLPEEEAVDLVNCYIAKPNSWPYDNTAERDGKTYYAPSGVIGSSYAFSAGRYQQKVYGLVTDGKLTLGLRDDRTTCSAWVYFSNFKLTYQANNPEAITAMLEGLQKQADAYQTAAIEAGKTFYQGYYTDIQSLIAEFEATDDVEAQYSLLAAINEGMKKFAPSVELYAKLYTALDLAYNDYWAAAGTFVTDEDIKAFEQDIYNPLMTVVQEGTLTDEEVQAKIDELKSLPIYVPIAPNNRWTFDNAEDLLAAATGTATLQPVLMPADDTCEIIDDINAAGITPAEGPTADNGAAHLPKNAGLFSTLGLAEETMNYTLQLDIKVQDADSYNGIIQTDLTNSGDADLFYSEYEIGVGDLGYSGTIQADTWHRIVCVNRNGDFTVYVDGVRCNTANNDRWTIRPEGLLFFADNDGERVDTDVAEIAFWNTPMTDSQISNLGKVDTTPTGIERIETPTQPVITGFYDLTGRKMNPKNAKKGIYILNGKKVVIK